MLPLPLLPFSFEPPVAVPLGCLLFQVLQISRQTHLFWEATGCSLSLVNLLKQSLSSSLAFVLYGGRVHYSPFLRVVGWADAPRPHLAHPAQTVLGLGAKPFCSLLHATQTDANNFLIS